MAAGSTALILGGSAHASLGGPYSSVEADRAHMAARISASAAPTHTVHALTLANGAVTREFVRGDGTVFAVAWRGPSRPDLRQLLGGYFDTLQADSTSRSGVRSRRPIAVRRADFVVQSGGRPGGFWGVAYLPQMAPAGFSTRDLK